jgi:hypothetical protein
MHILPPDTNKCRFGQQNNPHWLTKPVAARREMGDGEVQQVLEERVQVRRPRGARHWAWHGHGHAAPLLRLLARI